MLWFHLQTRLETSSKITPKRPRLCWVYVYVALIPFVNWCFANSPTVPMPDGGEWYPMAIVTGLVLVFRDFAQREVQHLILLPLLIGIGLSYFMAPAEIALASGIAFAVSEMVDYMVYSISNRPLSERVMLSSALSAPLDSTLFLVIANMAIPGIFTWLTLATSIASKLLGAYVVYLILKRKEVTASLSQR